MYSCGSKVLEGLSSCEVRRSPPGARPHPVDAMRVKRFEQAEILGYFQRTVVGSMMPPEPNTNGGCLPLRGGYHYLGCGAGKGFWCCGLLAQPVTGVAEAIRQPRQLHGLCRASPAVPLRRMGVWSSILNCMAMVQ